MAVGALVRLGRRAWLLEIWHVPEKQRSRDNMRFPGRSLDAGMTLRVLARTVPSGSRGSRTPGGRILADAPPGAHTQDLWFRHHLSWQPSDVTPSARTAIDVVDAPFHLMSNGAQHSPCCLLKVYRPSLPRGKGGGGGSAGVTPAMVWAGAWLGPPPHFCTTVWPWG